LASIALQLKGYRILARRFKSRLGEIDLIALKGVTVVFVEVKSRSSLEEAEASMTHHQSQRLRRAAQAWAAHHQFFVDFDQRFDAVFVIPGAWPKHIIDRA